MIAAPGRLAAGAGYCRRFEGACLSLTKRIPDLCELARQLRGFCGDEPTAKPGVVEGESGLLYSGEGMLLGWPVFGGGQPMEKEKELGAEVGDKPWQTIRLWGLPLAVVTIEQVLAEVDRRIVAREPMHAVSANLNYAMLCGEHPELNQLNDDPCTVLLTDGMPLIWAANRRGTPLPERVAGSDLIYRLADLAALRGYGLYLLGAPPGVAEEAAASLAQRSPGLRVVGTYSPPYRSRTVEEEAELAARIREAKPDILLVAFGQPQGEFWIRDHQAAMGVPFCMHVGASIDFAAGRVRRAPRWMQKTGLEWLFRLSLEPRRLGGRYFRNGVFLMRRMVSGAFF